MNVSLSPELEKFVEKQVASQRYQTASEVVRHALRQMQDAELRQMAELDILRQAVRAGLDQMERGEYVTGKELSVDRIRKLAVSKFGDPQKRTGR